MGSPQIKFRKSLICKFADLTFLLDLRNFRNCADWDTKEICGLIITNLRICDLQTAHLRSLRLPNEPKILLIGLTKKKFAVPPLHYIYFLPVYVYCMVRSTMPSASAAYTKKTDLQYDGQSRYSTVLVNYFSVTKFTNFTSTDQQQLCSVRAT